MDTKELSPQPEAGSMRFHTFKHLTFPFALLEDRIQRMPTGDEYEILSDAMPDHTELGIMGSYFVLYVDKLPPRPWPVTVAGLPLFIATNNNRLQVPYEVGQNGKPGFEVLNELDAGVQPSKEMSNTVIRYFEALNVKIVVVAWIVTNWRITIEDFDGSVDLPETICQARARYIFRASVTGAA